MATSAQTLSLIIDELLKAKPANRDAAIDLLAAKGYLPKKLTFPILSIWQYLSNHLQLLP